MENAENSLGTFLVNRYGDRYLHVVNRNAFDTAGSDALYRSMYGDPLFTEYQFNIIIGTDSGIFPRFIAKNGVPKGSRYLFVELPKVLAALCSEGLLEDLPEEICVTTLQGWIEEAKKFQLADYILLGAVSSQGSMASSDAHLPEYREVSWALGLELQSVTQKLQASTNCTQFVLRQIENLAENRLCFDLTLANAFAGRTAILLAGGPSLQDALPWVKKNRDNVVVIAVSRISRILLAQGIVPHIITTVDPQEISFEVSRDMLRYGKGLNQPLLVQSHHASPLLVGQWQGRSVFTSALFPWRTPLNVATLFHTGPTVGNYALSIAMHMGCANIILAGVDLCFTPKGQTHAAGSDEDKVAPDLGQISPRVETYGGALADTGGYAPALDVLRFQASEAAKKGHRIYNCGLGAAKVPFIEYRSLEEVELELSSSTPAEILASRVPESTAKERSAHYRLIKKELSRARHKFQEILNLSREALECADGLFGTNGKQRDFRHKIRMDKIERRLEGIYRDFSLLIRQVGIKKFLTILKAPKQAEEWTNEQIEKATRDYYESYVAGAEYFIELTDEALHRLDSRLEEEGEHPDCARLFSQWEKDRQFGRLLIWRQNHPDRTGAWSFEERNKAQRLEQEFHTMLEDRTVQIERLKKGRDLKHIRSKALLLFKRRENGELEEMARGLAGHPDQEKALPYLHFINGLVAELLGEPAEAVAHYQNLLDGLSHPLTEDALLQITHLSIASNDVDNARLALECLIGISQNYLSAYGDLLMAIGDFEAAFNAYNLYLGIAPGDITALVKLGILCKEAGLADAAQELFQRVLDKDPQNSAALAMIDGAVAAGQG